MILEELIHMVGAAISLSFIGEYVYQSISQNPREDNLIDNLED